MSFPTAPRKDRYLTAPVGRLFAATALPVILVISMSGLMNVIDAVFLGHFVGPSALSAITVIFPVTMLMIALATLIATGMASQLARRLGAGDTAGAQAVFAAAHGLALAVAAMLLLAFLLVGDTATTALARGDVEIAGMARRYLGISVLTAPLMFWVSVQADGLRNEGRATLMAGLGLIVTLANIGFNYLLIGVLGLGVAGSAWGTAAAQFLALCVVLAFRLRAETPLTVPGLLRRSWIRGWGRVLVLGLPPSLGFLGIALVSASIIAAIQITGGEERGTTIAAYGIVTRILGFAILPVIGLGQALQAIGGNNHGAGQQDRAEKALAIALVAAALYCLAVELVMLFRPAALGRLFVDDAEVVAAVARILPIMSLFYVVSGPISVLSTWFQAMGDAGRAALLALSRPFVLAPLCILAVATFRGGAALWWALPLADGLMLLLVLGLLLRTGRRTGRRLGLFGPGREVRP